MRVLERTSETVWIELYSPEFPVVSQKMFMFWGAFAKRVFEGTEPAADH